MKKIRPFPAKRVSIKYESTNSLNKVISSKGKYKVAALLMKLGFIKMLILINSLWPNDVI